MEEIQFSVELNYTTLKNLNLLIQYLSKNLNKPVYQGNRCDLPLSQHVQ